MKIDTVELCNKKRAGALTNDDFYDLCDAYNEKVMECEEIINIVQKVYDNGIATTGNKCASLVEPLYKILMGGYK